MQKLIPCLIILLSLFCTSCNMTIKKSGKQKVVIDFTSHSVKRFKASEFAFNEHSYIYFHTGSGKFESGGVVHNPDCRCFKQDNKY